MNTMKYVLYAPDMNHVLQLEKYVRIEHLLKGYDIDQAFRIVLSQDKTRVVALCRINKCASQTEYNVVSNEFVARMKEYFNILSPREYVEAKRHEIYLQRQREKIEESARQLDLKIAVLEGRQTKLPKREESRLRKFFKGLFK